jgi:hypothetical protein
MGRGVIPMPQTDTLAAFYLALDETPGDPLTVQALADWYEELDQLDAASCLRWTARRGRFPFKFRRDDPNVVIPATAMTDGWYWWAKVTHDFGRDWGHPRNCWLPEPLWAQLTNLSDHHVSIVKHFPTIQQAYEALFDAWPRFAPSQRERWS